MRRLTALAFRSFLRCAGFWLKFCWHVHGVQGSDNHAFLTLLHFARRTARSPDLRKLMSHPVPNVSRSTLRPWAIPSSVIKLSGAQHISQCIGEPPAPIDGLELSVDDNEDTEDERGPPFGELVHDIDGDPGGERGRPMGDSLADEPECEGGEGERDGVALEGRVLLETPPAVKSELDPAEREREPDVPLEQSLEPLSLSVVATWRSCDLPSLLDCRLADIFAQISWSCIRVSWRTAAQHHVRRAVGCVRENIWLRSLLAVTRSRLS